jgi:hypothetical protein
MLVAMLSALHDALRGTMLGAMRGAMRGAMLVLCADAEGSSLSLNSMWTKPPFTLVAQGASSYSFPSSSMSILLARMGPSTSGTDK